MVDDKAGRARLLFVLSNDYGELFSAMYFVKRRAFETVLLMPDRLYRANGDSLPVAAQPYATIHDVCSAVEREHPQVVFLFSGYLYAANGIFDLEALEKLVCRLRNCDCRIATSDPFLGILAKLDASTFSDLHPRKDWLHAHFSRVYAVFEHVAHVYLVDPGESGIGHSVSFFNEQIIMAQAELADCGELAARRIDAAAAGKRWLFVLSEEDYGAQAARHGRDWFDGLIVDKLRQTAREGRQPILVAPQACIDSVRRRTPSTEGFVLLPLCDHELFTSLLLDAEYAFFWNIFSSSILLRVMNLLPVFFFDCGHLARAVPPLFERGVKQYYDGSEPDYLQQQAELDCGTLASLACEQLQPMRDAVDRFRRYPTPEEMVEKILQS